MKTTSEAYHRDGFVVLRGVFPDEVLASLERGVDTNMPSPSAWSNDYAGPRGGGVGAVNASDDQRGRLGRFFDDYVNWGRISEYRRAALSGPLPRIAADLMGTRRPRFYHEHALVKEPGGTASQTPWDQDDPYYGVDSDVNVSLWVPIDPVPDVVALRILTGSHARGRPRFVPHRFVDDVPSTRPPPATTTLRIARAYGPIRASRFAPRIRETSSPSTSGRSTPRRGRHQPTATTADVGRSLASVISATTHGGPRGRGRPRLRLPTKDSYPGTY